MSNLSGEMPQVSTTNQRKNNSGANNNDTNDEENKHHNNPKFYLTSNWLIPSARGNQEIDDLFSKDDDDDGDDDDNNQGMPISNDEEQSIVSDSNSQYFDAENSGNHNFYTEQAETNHTRLQKRLSKSINGGFRERHKENLSTRLTADAHWLRFRFQCGLIINHPRVQLLVICLIILNAATMGGSTFLTEDQTKMIDIFRYIDMTFLIIYTIEIIMQFIYFGWRMILDSWLAFDLFVVVISWISDASQFTDDTGSGGGGQFQIIRAFRIFRALRLLTRIKVLRDLVAAIGEVIPRMIAIIMLMFLIFYIFAVLFTELFRELEIKEYYANGDSLYPFNSLTTSLFTCIELMTLEWSGYAREAMAQIGGWAWIPFIVFIFISGFIVSNLIIAVICDAVSLIDKVAREREALANGTILETPDQQLEFCQSSIIHLSERVQLLQQSQQHLQDLMEVLASEMATSCGKIIHPPTITTKTAQNSNSKDQNTTTTTRNNVTFSGVNDIHSISGPEETKTQPYTSPSNNVSIFRENN